MAIRSRLNTAFGVIRCEEPYSPLGFVCSKRIQPFMSMTDIHKWYELKVGAIGYLLTFTTTIANP